VHSATYLGDVIYVKYGTWQVGPEVAVTNLPGLTIRGGYAGNGAPGAFTNLPTIVTCNSPSFTNRLFYCSQSTVTFDNLTLTGGLAGLTNNIYTPNYAACQGGAIWASNFSTLMPLEAAIFFN